MTCHDTVNRAGFPAWLGQSVTQLMTGHGTAISTLYDVAAPGGAEFPSYHNNMGAVIGHVPCARAPLFGVSIHSPFCLKAKGCPLFSTPSGSW